jgi:hypothetical protein
VDPAASIHWVRLSSLHSDREALLRRARWCIGAFIVGLVLSGVTAFPLETELGWLVRMVEHTPLAGGGLGAWLTRVYGALAEENARYPFLAYGTDWLGFAHLVIAVAFVGPLRDPVRNRWVLLFGLIACAGVLPLALIAGPLRGIPFYWRLIDCSFGVVGAAVLWPAYRIAGVLEASLAASIPSVAKATLKS